MLPVWCIWKCHSLQWRSTFVFVYWWHKAPRGVISCLLQITSLPFWFWSAIVDGSVHGFPIYPVLNDIAWECAWDCPWSASIVLPFPLATVKSYMICFDRQWSLMSTICPAQLVLFDIMYDSMFGMSDRSRTLLWVRLSVNLMFKVLCRHLRW